MVLLGVTALFFLPETRALPSPETLADLRMILSTPLADPRRHLESEVAAFLSAGGLDQKQQV